MAEKTLAENQHETLSQSINETQTISSNKEGDAEDFSSFGPLSEEMTDSEIQIAESLKHIARRLFPNRELE